MVTAAKYNLTNLCFTEEIKRGYLSAEEAERLILLDEGLSFIDNGAGSLLLGQTKTKSALVKVCTNLGLSSEADLKEALYKIDVLNKLTYKPDIVFDHTGKYATTKPFWRYMVENFDGIVATSPVVVCFDETKGIEENMFLESIEEMAASGVRLMLFQPTATREIWETAK